MSGPAAPRAFGGAALQEILRCAGLELETMAAALEVGPTLDAGGLLRTPFYAERVATAALAALGLVAEELRTRPAQKVRVDPVMAAAAVRQDRYMKIHGESVKTWDEFSGIYRTGDPGRFMQLHCNFAHHRDRALKVLGLSKAGGATRADADAAMARESDAFDLEARFFEAGACAATVRTWDEWDAHPQRSAVAGLELIEFDKVPNVDRGAAQRRVEDWARRRQDSGAGASGLRCLDLTRVLAGPIAGRSLADLGASVMRVSGPGRPFIHALCMMTGAGKRACEIDLETPEGRAAMESLLETTDVFLNAYRRDCLDKHGLDSMAIATRHPGIIVVEVDAYSRKGPWTGKRGFDSLVQCATGLAHAHSTAVGKADNVQHLPVQLLDYVTGYLAAFAALAARREQVATKDPSSRIVRLSLARTAQFLWDQGLKPAGEAWETGENVPVALIESALIERTAADGSRVTLLDLPWATVPETPAAVGETIEALGASPARWESLAST